MGDVITRVMKHSEVRWGFIHIPYTKRDFFPDREFIIICKDMRFNVAINKVNRIVRKNLLRTLGARTGTPITIKKISQGIYSIETDD